MGKRKYTEAEYHDAVVAAQVEATKNIFRIFNEAYMLGVKHAKGEQNEQN